MTIIQALLSPFVPFTPSTRSVVNATGGNDIVISGSYKVHIFTGPGTFTVTSAPSTTQILYFVVGGGGGGGASGESSTYGYCGAGGGAGGFRAGILPLQTFSTPSLGPGPWVLPITVGAGGAGGVNDVPTYPFVPSVTGYGAPGSPSIFSIKEEIFNTFIESSGGGGGASFYLPGPSTYVGLNGGSGGGSVSWGGSNSPVPGGLGNIPSVPPSPPNLGGPQGQPGANIPSGLSGSTPTRIWGSGGGGASQPGGYPPQTYAGDRLYYGGIGKPISVVPLAYGDSTIFAGGGDGGTRPPYNAITVPEPPSPSGYNLGGGGKKNPANNPASPGLVNSGGGGAGASGTTPGYAGGAGAPGIVVVGYLYQ